MKPALSFAEILEEKMAEGRPSDEAGAEHGEHDIGSATGSTPISPTELPPEAFSFDWSRLVKTKLQSAYHSPREPSAKVRDAAMAKPGPARLKSEPEWPIGELSTAGRLALEKLYIESGSVGCTISRSLVKRAFRRLAKRLHPDVAVERHTTGKLESREAFLLVQEAYDVVVGELERLEKRSSEHQKKAA